MPDGRTVLTAACLVHGTTLAVAVLLYPHVWVGVTAVLLAPSGLVGPLLTGTAQAGGVIAAALHLPLALAIGLTVAAAAASQLERRLARSG